MKTTTSFSLDTEVDKDIQRWLEQQPPNRRSEAIRAAIREHLAHGGITVGDVYQAVQALRKDIQSRTFAAAAGGNEPEIDEPAAAVAALDRLGEL